ncbi:MAG: hypothetical protein ACTSRG_05720 [Candidatus Helarchaeota archaeon]
MSQIYSTDNPLILNSLDDKNDALGNISRAEDGIFANYEVLFGAELNEGDILSLVFCLSYAVYYLNLAESEYYNGNYINAINYANHAYSISLNLLPISILKGLESFEDKEFMMKNLPIIIIVVVISIILGIVLLYYLGKTYLKKRADKKILKKNIIIPENQT